MKKKLMALILCMVMALGLTACRMPSDGKRDADNSDVTQSQTQSYEAKDITVAALKGPTAIGMVKLMEDSKKKRQPIIMILRLPHLLTNSVRF